MQVNAMKKAKPEEPEKTEETPGIVQTKVKNVSGEGIYK